MQIKSRFNHFNFNVMDLEKSVAFYKKALGFTEIRRHNAKDGSFTLVFLGDSSSGSSPDANFSLELTWLRDKKEPYNLGDNESHLCVTVDGDYEQIRSFHKEMGCVCYENTGMGLYFIEDPDGYWIEIVRNKK